MIHRSRLARRDFLKLAAASGISSFKDLNPPPLPVSPNWSPVTYYGGYHNPKAVSKISYMPAHVGCCSPLQSPNAKNSPISLNNVGSLSGLWGNMGCACFV